MLWDGSRAFKLRKGQALKWHAAATKLRGPESERHQAVALRSDGKGSREPGAILAPSPEMLSTSAFEIWRRQETAKIIDSNQSNLLTRSDWKIRCGSRQEVLKLNLHTARSYHLESAHHLKAIYCRDGPVRLTTNIEQWSITRWIDIWIVDTSQAITYLQYNDCSTGFVIVRAIVLVLFFHLSGSHVMYSLLSCQRYDWIKSVKALWFWSFNNAAQSRSFVLVTTPITVLDRQPRMQPLKNPLLRIHCQSLHRYQKAATFVQALARNRHASESNKCPQS